jgi:hypothetical protein
VKRARQFIFVCVVALLITSVVSHAVVRWLGIKATGPIYLVFGSQVGKPAASIYGASPAFDGLDWNQVAQLLGGGIQTWATAGSSPSEWEMLQLRSPDVPRTFVCFTPFDLNDYFLCDFRAKIVPFGKTVRELREAGADWSFSKRMLSQYPLTFIRKLFPTAGRSNGVMVGIRRGLQKMIGRSKHADLDRVPQLGSTGPNMTQDRITDWDAGRLQRRVEMMRAGCQGKQWFDGPKKQALLRMVRQAAAHGTVTIIVLPLSPTYQREFMTAKVTQDFERTLTDVQASCAASPMIRLDKLSVLHDDGLFWDLVHLNMYGQKIATAELLAKFQLLPNSQ